MSGEIEIMLRSDEVIVEDRSFNKVSLLVVSEQFRISESFSRKFSLMSKSDDKPSTEGETRMRGLEIDLTLFTSFQNSTWCLDEKALPIFSLIIQFFLLLTFLTA